MRKRRQLLLAALFTGFLPLGARAQTSAQRYPADGVVRLDSRLALDLTILQGDHEGLVINGEDDELKRIRVTTKDGAMVIAAAENSSHALFGHHNTLSGTLTVKTLNALTVAGAGTVNVVNLKTSKLSVLVSGAGEIQLKQLNADALDVVIAGKAELGGSGSATALVVDVSGAGNVSLEGLQAAIARVSISGAGNVTVAARDQLDVRIAGLGEVAYRGNPQLTQAISGLGHIKQLAS